MEVVECSTHAVTQTLWRGMSGQPIELTPLIILPVHKDGSAGCLSVCSSRDLDGRA